MQKDAQHATNIILVKHLNISLIERISMLETSKIKKQQMGFFSTSKQTRSTRLIGKAFTSLILKNTGSRER